MTLFFIRLRSTKNTYTLEEYKEINTNFRTTVSLNERRLRDGLIKKTIS